MLPKNEKGSRNNKCGVNTVRELCEMMWKIEVEGNLLDLEVGNVKIWQHLRMQIYYKIGRYANVLERPYEFNAEKSKISRFFSLLKGSVIANPFLKLNRIDTIVFDHPRSTKVDGKWIDIYTYQIVKEIKKRIKFNVLERSFEKNHSRKRTKETAYLDFFILVGEIKARFFKSRLTSQEEQSIKKIQTNIFKKCGIDIELTRWFEFEANKFSAIYKLFTIYFKKKSPESIFVLVSYALGYVVKAAKECGVQVIELQHGVISRYHLGYSYPRRLKTVDYFPDQLWTWGSYWNTSCDFPLHKKDIVVYGNYYFNAQKKKYSKYRKIKNTVLFISQGVIGNKIVDFIIKVLPFLEEDYKITLKLHPGEYDRYKDYNNIDNILSSPNVEIEKEADLFHLFSVTEYQIGVFSTAIFEGLSFGCKTVLLEMPGVEYMEQLLKEKLVKLCDKPESLRCIMSSFDNNPQETFTGNYTDDFRFFQ